jgi:protein phosphatase
MYRMRDDNLAQLTVDHSLLQELVDKGFYTWEEASKSVQKNLVTRAIGVEEMVEAEVIEHEVVAGDIYLMCSDGLTDLVEDDEILLTLRKYNANLDLAAEHLIQMANDSGGKDNISVILAQARKPLPVRSRTTWYGKLLNWFN